MRDWRHWNDVSLRLIAQLVRLIPSAGPCSASKSRHSVQTPSAVQIRVSLAVSSHPPSAKNCFFSTRLFAPAHFLSGQQGLREPKAYTLLLRLGSQRQAARPFGLGEVEYAVERRALDAGGMRRLRPRLAEGSAGNRLLHCDRQHAPPATRPA